MTFGLAEKDWSLFKALVLQPLWHAGAKLYIFGSRAENSHQPFSDVDLLIDDSGCSSDFPIVLSQAQEAIEESQFPIKVDMVILRNLVRSYFDSVLSSRVEILPDRKSTEPRKPL